jgi:hypothetical protein
VLYALDKVFFFHFFARVIALEDLNEFLCRPVTVPQARRTHAKPLFRCVLVDEKRPINQLSLDAMRAMMFEGKEREFPLELTGRRRVPSTRSDPK